MKCPECEADAGLGLCHECGYDARVKPDNPSKVGTPIAGSRPPSEVTLTLPWDVLPSDNLRTRRKGDAKAQKYRRKKEAMEAHMVAQAGPGRPLIPEGDVAVRLRFYPPDNRRRDMSNLLKAIQDSMEDIILADDYQIVRESWERHEPDQDARCEVEVLRIQAGAAA